MHFIKLTFAQDGSKFDCNAERIAYMYLAELNTHVFFGGENDDMIAVKETPTQILKLISDPEFLP